ncbi:MAG: DEAD/DEAH box helicase family protein, partial [Blastocatellia bacterium]|nr:DEAD/DEAH box helicase family protein [Blastocatellia bacterium]
FLRPHQSELAALGGLAEAQVHTGPVYALVRLRTFAEQFVKDVYTKLKLPLPMQANLYDLTRETSFKKAIPQVIINKLDSIRIQGNKAAHGESCPTNTALWILHEAFEIGSWYYIALCNGDKSQLPQFKEPLPNTPKTADDEQSRKERKQILEKLAAQEAQMQQLLQELEKARAQAQTAEKSAEELEAILATGQQAVSALQFNEETTRRRMIDTMLVAAGWDVGENGRSTEQVRQEFEVLHQPTPSGKGIADYVLFGDDEKPLAVLESKKTVLSAENGRTQAQLYADGLEKQYGQRPVIFYTNGFETYLWNDTMKETPRQLHGFYSKDSLDYLIFQRTQREHLANAEVNPNIAGRMYQIEAVRRVTERFTNGHRRALIVMATGTGKTRVAVSMCELLTRAKWAKRILFLCDRRELRKQAKDVFTEYLPGEPLTIVSANTAQDRDKRIYLGTYPAMMKCFQSFDPGYFDLIIADESHRSIYNRYRDLFLYFDALQVGLTATPIRLIARNTYQMFGCEDQDPTAYFDYDNAINHNPPYLVPYEVFKTTTQFQRDGIRYSQMSEEQRRQIEESEGDPNSIEFDAAQVDRQVFNKDTNRAILRNLMENGIRDGSDSRPGKSIIFARSHKHAVLLQQLFEEMYPQYGGNFCRVIDNYDPRAEQLIDDFKGIGNHPDLTVAISVDMLDTGIDIPEVVNLVFAKPLKSFVKFWQMIGRGTRLCPNLFGPGRDKTGFRIFDHWGNFTFFEEQYKEVNVVPSKALLQQLFEARIELAETALAQQDATTFDAAVDLLRRDIADLPLDSISVKEKLRDVHTVQQGDTIKAFAPTTVSLLESSLAPLMQWRNIGNDERAYQFDLLMTKLQTERLKGSATFDNLKARVQQEASTLPINLNQVRGKLPTIEQVRSDEFWNAAQIADLEKLRQELRAIIHFNQLAGGPTTGPKIIDVKEDESQIQIERHIPKLDGLKLAAYRKRVEEVLQQLIDDSPALQKIKVGAPVSPADLEELCGQVARLQPDVNLKDLGIHYPDLADHLDIAIRSIIGLDAGLVSARFDYFVHQHPELNSKQLRFLGLLKNHLSRYGSIEIERLYEAPFTTIDSNGIDGVFSNDAQINELLDIIATFNLPKSNDAAGLEN